MKEILIRELSIEDLKSDSGFFKALTELAPVNLSDEAAQEIYFHRQHVGVRTVVAIIEEEVVGTASMLLEYKFIHKGSVVAHIEDVAVQYDFQKMGIGKLLTQELLKIAQSIGCYKAVLHCDPDKVAFYEKNGFFSINGMRIDFGEK